MLADTGTFPLLGLLHHHDGFMAIFLEVTSNVFHLPDPRSGLLVGLEPIGSFLSHPSTPHCRPRDCQTL